MAWTTFKKKKKITQVLCGGTLEHLTLFRGCLEAKYGALRNLEVPKLLGPTLERSNSKEATFNTNQCTTSAFIV